MHIQLSSGTTGKTFGVSLHSCPFFVYAGCEGSCETLHMGRLVGAFATSLCSLLSIIKLLGPCITMLYAMSRSLVKLMEIGISLGRG